MSVVLELPDELRVELKDPLGPIETDAETVLAEADGPLVTVGDVVTYHVLEAGGRPTLAIVDDRTERSAVDEEIRSGIGGFDHRVAIENPPATLTDDLLVAIRDGLSTDAATLVTVDGEEDLAALPAVLAAPADATVLYGQPGEGMVVVVIDERVRATVRDLLERMTGDTERAWESLGIGGV